MLGRHSDHGSIGHGFVKGFGITRGAIASSIGHDSHNICVIGCNDADMAAAVNRLIALRGGFASVVEGQVTAELALPIAGLMSERPFEDSRAGPAPAARRRRGHGRDLARAVPADGVPGPAGDPASQDHRQGLVDVDKFELV